MAFEDIKKFYRAHLLRHSPSDIRSMGWHDKDEYLLRFKLACEIGDLDGRSVLDVGCGIGGLLEHFKDNGINAAYTGVDILPEMVKICAQNNPGCHVRCADILQDDVEGADYVFCIGTLNISEPEFSHTFRQMVGAMLKLAGKGVAISFLCDSRYLAGSQYHIEDPQKLKTYIEDELGARVRIHDQTLLRGECLMFIYFY